MCITLLFLKRGRGPLYVCSMILDVHQFILKIPPHQPGVVRVLHDGHFDTKHILTHSLRGWEKSFLVHTLYHLFSPICITVARIPFPAAFIRIWQRKYKASSLYILGPVSINISFSSACIRTEGCGINLRFSNPDELGFEGKY